MKIYHILNISDKYIHNSVLIIFFILFISSPQLFSAGFRIVENTASALGLANAVVANVDDASAVVFNSAALTELKGNNISSGITVISSNTDYSGVVSEDMKKNYFFPPNLYFSTDKLSNKFSLGIGINTPFGLGTEWSNTGYFKYVSTLSEIKTFGLTTVLAEKLTNNFSYGVGINYYYSKVKLNRVGAYSQADALLNDGDIFVDGDGTAWGWNFSFLYKLNSKTKLGFNYTSKFSIDYSGDLKLYNFPVPSASQVFYQTEAFSKFNYPATAALGLGYKIDDRISLEFDLNWTDWSVYNELKVVSNINTNYVQKNWRDAWAYRTGLKFNLNNLSVLKLGFAVDKSPVPNETYDSLLPCGDRNIYAIGYSRKLSNNLTMDMAYQYLKFDEVSLTDRALIPITVGSTTVQQLNINGDYNSFINIFSINLNWNF